MEKKEIGSNFERKLGCKIGGGNEGFFEGGVGEAKTYYSEHTNTTASTQKNTKAIIFGACSGSFATHPESCPG